MTKETMTVHMLLSELKTIEKRIDKAIKAITPIAIKENASKNVNGISVEDYTKTTKTEEQRALNLIARQNAMKGVLYKYNTEKEITVGDVSMTIAHALWLKEYGMAQKRALLDHYERAYTKARTEVETANGNALNAAADRAADVSCGSKDKSNSEEYMKIIEQYKESHRKVYVDPLELKERINALSEELQHLRRKLMPGFRRQMQLLRLRLNINPA